MGSYDERGRRIALSAARRQAAAGISCGGLLEHKLSDGNEVLRVGDILLFKSLVRANIELFDQLGIHKIVTLSLHA